MSDGSERAPVDLRKGLLALAFVIVTWSLIPIVLKYFSYRLDRWTVTGFRSLVATGFLLPFFLRECRLGRVSPGIWRRALWPSVFNLGGQILWSVAPYYNQAGILMFVGRSAFLFSILYSIILLPEERRTARSPAFLVGAALTVSGLFLMFLGCRSAQGTSPAGLLIMIGTAACWGMYGVSLKTWLKPDPAGHSFPLVCIYTSPVYAIIFFVFGEPASLADLSAPDLGLLIISAILAIGLGHTFSWLVFRTFGPILTEGFYQTIPFFAAVLAGLLLGEQLVPFQWAGGITIICGSGVLFYLLMRSRRAQVTDADLDPRG